MQNEIKSYSKKFRKRFINFYSIERRRKIPRWIISMHEKDGIL